MVEGAVTAESLHKKLVKLRPDGQVLIYRPAGGLKDDLSSSRRKDPRLILLFGFFNAGVKFIAKNFLAKYLELYPTSTFAFVKNEISWFLNDLRTNESHLEPLVKIVAQEVYEAPAVGGSRPGLLIHVLSNGGGFVLCAFAKMLERHLQNRVPSPSARTTTQTTPIPLAIVFDSLPSNNELSLIISVFAHVQNPYLRIASRIPAAIFVLGSSFVYLVIGRTLPFTSLHRRLERKDVIVGADSSTPRLYIYGESDEQVDQRHVEEHIRRVKDRPARGEGDNDYTRISIEKFDNTSAHVKHVLTDPERYWSAVVQVWERALERVDDTGDLTRPTAEVRTKL